MIIDQLIQKNFFVSIWIPRILLTIEKKKKNLLKVSNKFNAMEIKKGCNLRTLKCSK